MFSGFKMCPVLISSKWVFNTEIGIKKAWPVLGSCIDKRVILGGILKSFPCISHDV